MVTVNVSVLPSLLLSFGAGPAGWAWVGFVIGAGATLFSTRDCLRALDDVATEIALEFDSATEADCHTIRGETTIRILRPSASFNAGFCSITAPPSPTRVCAVPAS